MFYKYDETTKIYLGETEGQAHPEKPGVYLQPANTTTLKPPKTKKGEMAVFVWDKWEIIESKAKLSERETPKEKADKAGDLILMRNALLDETDKYMMPDFPIDEYKRILWQEYRQYLRDITKAKDFPDLQLQTFDQWNKNQS